MAQPTYTADEFAFVSDDGTEAGATVGTTDANITQEAGTDNRHRIRIQLHNTNNKTASETWNWEYSYQSGTWTTIDDSASSYVRAITTSFAGGDPANGDDCTNRLTTRGTYDGTNSGWSADGTSGDGTTLDANAYFEIELCYYLIEESGVADGHTIDLRVVEASGDTITWTPSYPRTTYSIPVPASDNQPAYIHGKDTDSDNKSAYIEGITGTLVRDNKSAYIEGFEGLVMGDWRWRPEGAEEGANDNTSWEAAANTAVTLDMLAVHGGLVTRLRQVIEGVGSQGAIIPKLQYRKNGGTWTTPRDWDYVDPGSEVTPFSECMVINKEQVTDGAATTAIISSATGFTAGTHEHNATAASVTLNDAHTELEWQILISRWYATGGAGTGRNEVVEGDYFEFRVVESDDTVFGQYPGTYPKVTVNIPPEYIGGTGIETSTARSFIEIPDGTLYTVMEDKELGAEILMHKSTDGGNTWVAQDKTELLNDVDMESFAMVYDDTNKIIHCLHQPGGPVQYYQFGTKDHATLADQWVLNSHELETGVTSTNQSVEIILRGSTLYAFYPDTSTTEQIWYQKKPDLSTTNNWASRVSIDTTGGTTDFSGVSAVLGPSSDDIHIFYSDFSNFNLHHRTLDTSDVLGTIHTCETDLPSNNDSQHGMTNAVCWYNGTTEKAMIGYVDETNGYLYTVIVEDDGTPNSRQVASNNVAVLTDPQAVNSRQPTASLALDDLVVWVSYALDADEDLWKARNKDGGGWTGHTEERDGQTVHAIRGQIIRDTGIAYYGYIWETTYNQSGVTPKSGYAGTNQYSRFDVGAYSNQSAYIEGTPAGTNVSDNKSAYIKGSDTAADNKSAYIAGGVNVSDNKSAYIKGSDTAADNKSAYIAGTDTAADNKSAYIAGTDTAADNKSAYIAGTDTAADNKSAYIAGTDTAADNKSAYIAGTDTAADNKSAYVAGGVNVSDNQAAYMAGSINVTDNKSAYIEGVGAGTPAEDNKSAYIAGTDTASDNKSAYVAGGVETSDSQAAYVAGGVETSDSQAAYISGGVNVADNKSAYIEGLTYFPFTDDFSTESDNDPPKLSHWTVSTS